jgi:hypothetical protein
MESTKFAVFVVYAFPYISLVSNNVVHSHFTRTNVNLHINCITTVDKHNFVYHTLLAWNNCPFEICSLINKFKFIASCKMLLFQN